MVRQALRARLWRSAGMEIGSEVDIRAHCWVFSSALSVGDGTLIGYGSHIENREPVHIGSRCSVAPQVSFVTSSHEKGERTRRAGAYRGELITVGDGCWIGARATLLPGVRLGDGCIVGAGAVVLGGDYESDALLVGVPARRSPLEA
jgi:maltose O-acetyltransferase